MDFGFSRFLEMFEERFGRGATTALMGALAIAVIAWAIQTTIEAAVYIYGLIKSAHFVPVLETEHAATHLVIFAAQVGFTFLVLAFIWRWFIRRRLEGYIAKFKVHEATWVEIEKKYEEYMGKHRALMLVVEKLHAVMDSTNTLVTLAKAEMQKKIAEHPDVFKAPASEPTPIREPPEKNEPSS
jgi:hypothetical protein